MNSWKISKRQFERAYLVAVLQETRGNVSEAARIAGKDRRDFYQTMDRNQVDPADFRPRKEWKQSAETRRQAALESWARSVVGGAALR